MKLASFRVQNKDSYGIVVGNGVIDLQKRTDCADLKSLLAKGLEHAACWQSEQPDYQLDDIQLLPPIPNPANILGVGLNTRSHAVEASEHFKQQIPDPVYPHLFTRNPMSQVAHGQPLNIPKTSTALDFEGEIAIVIGRAGRYISKENALDYIAGISCYNDGTIRDYQLHSQQVTAAKNFHGSGAFGPWITTMDEAGPLSELWMETRINGELRQRLTLDDLFFDFAALIEYASQPIHLQPGDVIVTGSPAGIGAIAGKYLKPGDEVAITIPTVGTLSNKVALEQ